eukprot:scaffold2063_cov401-Prasinococcus_capsulatus_cf.AAC.19
MLVTLRPPPRPPGARDASRPGARKMLLLLLLLLLLLRVAGATGGDERLPVCGWGGRPVGGVCGQLLVLVLRELALVGPCAHIGEPPGGDGGWIFPLTSSSGPGGSEPARRRHAAAAVASVRRAAPSPSFSHVERAGLPRIAGSCICLPHLALNGCARCACLGDRFVAILGIVPRLLCWLLGIQIPQANRGTGGGAVGASGGGAAAATTSRSGAPLSPQALYLRKKVGSGVRRIVVVLSRIVLREETPEELEQSATVVQEAADIVKVWQLLGAGKEVKLW